MVSSVKSRAIVRTKIVCFKFENCGYTGPPPEQPGLPGVNPGLHELERQEGQSRRSAVRRPPRTRSAPVRGKSTHGYASACGLRGLENGDTTFPIHRSRGAPRGAQRSSSFVPGGSFRPRNYLAAILGPPWAIAGVGPLSGIGLAIYGVDHLLLQAALSVGLSQRTDARTTV